MFHIQKKDRKTWITRILSHGLLFAIISYFSLHFQLDSFTAKVNSYSSISKVKNNLRSCHGKQVCAALIPAVVNGTPIFHPSSLIIFDKQNFLDGYLLESGQIRAPPFIHSL